MADIISKPLAGTLLTPGTSTPGETRQSFGGVGRNVAEGIARVLLARQRSSAQALPEAKPSSSIIRDGNGGSDGADVTLVSAVGADSAGKALVNGCHEAGVNAKSTVEVGYPSDMDGKSGSSGRNQAGTASYVAMLGCDGDLVAAVADMRVLERMTSVRSLTSFVNRCELYMTSWCILVFVIGCGSIEGDLRAHDAAFEQPRKQWCRRRMYKLNTGCDRPTRIAAAHGRFFMDRRKA